MTEVIRHTQDWLAIRKNLSKSVGFVPTMGALHQGHISLVERSREENAITLVSIFVNPTQFNDPKDLWSYPRTFEADLMRLQEAKTDYVFYPSVEDLYPDGYKYKISENQISKKLCGEFRPGHFEGMLTVVMKLLQIVKPKKAYFGEKDYQQLELIRGLAQAFFLEAEIVGCPTVREESGLAMSSRNERLSLENKLIASQFRKLLSSSMSLSEVKEALENLGFQVEYLQEEWGRRFGAVYLDSVRLIDNVSL